jgi:predicted RNA binding protein YcfA (HicA-like mRNA interferase family)
MSMSVRRHYLGLALLLTLATGAVLAAGAIVRAQDASHMDHAQHMHGGDTVAPTHPGQEAFGTIQEIVRLLEADPKTDWSKVNIGALREHLIDMDEVTMRAHATERVLDNGIEITVTGEGRTLGAIKRMVPAHVRELAALGWSARTEELPNGVKLVVTTSDQRQAVKLKALGFLGVMVQGAHHQPHHLMMAKGEFAH